MTLFHFFEKREPLRFSGTKRLVAKSISIMNWYVAIRVLHVRRRIFLLPSLSCGGSHTSYAKQKDGVKVTAEKSPTSAVVTT